MNVHEFRAYLPFPLRIFQAWALSQAHTKFGTAHRASHLWTLGYYSGKHIPAHRALLAQDHEGYGHLPTQCVAIWVPSSQLGSTKAQSGRARKERQRRGKALSPLATRHASVRHGSPRSQLSRRGRHLQCLTLLQRSQIKCTATASSDVYISFKLG